MNILRALGFGVKAEPPSAADELRAKLPEVNAFVDLAFGGSTVRESVPIDGITASAVIARCPDGLDPGAPADFVYTNPLGKYRFATVCVKVEGKEAHFDLPTSIKTLETFSARRMARRIPWVLPTQWRYAPDGAGFGEYLPASMMDLSVGGAALVVARTVKVGSQVEVRFTLNSNLKPFVELCQVMRAISIGSSGKCGTGLRFLKIDPKDQRRLGNFLDERQKLWRDRGFV